MGVVPKLELGQRERQAAPAEEGRCQPLAAKGRGLLDDARARLLGGVEAAVRGRVVVPALALVRPRKPERAVRGIRRGALVPRQAPVEDHANESERSARIARISSSVRPSRIRSIGRRSPSTGFSPKSQASAASRSYRRRRFDHTSSSRSTFSALSGSIPEPRSQRVTCARLTPSMSARRAAEPKSTRSASTFVAIATAMSLERSATLLVAQQNLLRRCWAYNGPPRGGGGTGLRAGLKTRSLWGFVGSPPPRRTRWRARSESSPAGATAPASTRSSAPSSAGPTRRAGTWSPPARAG